MIQHPTEIFTPSHEISFFKEDVLRVSVLDTGETYVPTQIVQYTVQYCTEYICIVMFSQTN